MKTGRVTFDDPEDLSQPSSINVEFLMDLQLLDYARRVFERKGDTTSIERANEFRKFYKHMIEQYVYLVRAIIPDDIIRDQTEMVIAAIKRNKKKQGDIKE